MARAMLCVLGACANYCNVAGKNSFVMVAVAGGHTSLTDNKIVQFWVHVPFTLCWCGCGDWVVVAFVIELSVERQGKELTLPLKRLAGCRSVGRI